MPLPLVCGSVSYITTPTGWIGRYRSIHFWQRTKRNERSQSVVNRLKPKKPYKFIPKPKEQQQQKKNYKFESSSGRALLQQCTSYFTPAEEYQCRGCVTINERKSDHIFKRTLPSTWNRCPPSSSCELTNRVLLLQLFQLLTKSAHETPEGLSIVRHRLSLEHLSLSCCGITVNLDTITKSVPWCNCAIDTYPRAFLFTLCISAQEPTTNTTLSVQPQTRSRGLLLLVSNAP